MQVSEEGRDYNVVLANMGTINQGKKLMVEPTDPGVADDFAETFRKQKALDVDVWRPHMEGSTVYTTSMNQDRLTAQIRSLIAKDFSPPWSVSKRSI